MSEKVCKVRFHEIEGLTPALAEQFKLKAMRRAGIPVNGATMLSGFSTLNGELVIRRVWDGYIYVWRN